MSQALYTSPNVGEISSNTYEDSVFTQVLLVIARDDLDLHLRLFDPEN